MSQVAPSRSPIAIVEWRYDGHRLAYVAAIARAAIAEGRCPVLFTASGVPQTDEFRTHLVEIEDLDVRELTVAITGNRSFRAALREVEHQLPVGGIIVPEVDTLLPSLVLCRIFRRNAIRLSGIVMRPPRRGSTIRQGVWSVVKRALIRSERLCPNLKLHLLEDPLAAGSDLVWPSSLLAPGRRLDDPSDLYSVTDDSCIPAELQDLSAEGAWFTIMGLIDHRKQVPLALEAWQAAGLGDAAYLIIAGKQQSDVRHVIEGATAADGSIIAVDRYLENEEMGALIGRSTVLLLLYDLGISSGLLTTAASVGRWAIVLKGTRTGRIALENGFGVESDGSASGVAQAMHEVLRRTATPTSLQLPTAKDFGRAILDWHR